MSTEGKDWKELLGGTLRGWFGVEYREKVTAVINQEEKTRRDAESKQGHDSIIWHPEPGEDHASLLREFDGLMELTPPQRDWLVRNTSTLILCLAMRAGGTRVNEYLREGVENREQLEKVFDLTTNVRVCDVEAAQREMLERAEEAKNVCDRT